MANAVRRETTSSASSTPTVAQSVGFGHWNSVM